MARPKTTDPDRERAKRIDKAINGSPKDKALLVIRDYIERKDMALEPLLSDDERDAIEGSLLVDGDETSTQLNIDKYYEWINLYNFHSKFSKQAAIGIQELRMNANELIALLYRLEDYEQEENHLNALFENLKETGSPEALQAFDRTLEGLVFSLARVTRTAKGYVAIDLSELFKAINLKAEAIRDFLACLKPLIAYHEKVTRKTKSRDFIPEILSEDLTKLKADTLIEIPSRYTRKALQEREARGEHPTEEERRKAIFPTYKEVKPNDFFVKRWGEYVDTLASQYDIFY